MKSVFLCSALMIFVATFARAQGTVIFSNGNNTRVSTNAVVAGPATGWTAGNTGGYIYALFYSQTESSVSGETNSISGSDSVDYAFNDGNWTLVAYGTNDSFAGRFISANQDSQGYTEISNLLGGATARFVVIGWSANIGTNIADVQDWFGLGDPLYAGWIGQSAVGGPVMLGGGLITPASLFGPPPLIPGFTLGMALFGAPSPPYISSQPTGLAVSVGASATFSVAVSGWPAPTFQWMLNKTNIVGATGPTLTINDVQTTNAGSYSVFISNSAGSTNSDAAILTVQTIGAVPPTISSQPANVSVQVGGNAIFAVGVSGTAPLSYQWSFNTTNILGGTNSSLTLTDVQTNNAGNYAVAMTNAYGTTNSAAATLAVTVPASVGYVIFANNASSPTKIYTNAAVGGADTGLTAADPGLYDYALYVSATATSVLGQTSAISGSASVDYAFNDPNWIFVAYGTNLLIRGRLLSASGNSEDLTPIPGFVGGASAQFVVIGWSANIGTDITQVQNWFGLGAPDSNGWIGQSAVSGPILLSDGGIMPPTVLFGFQPPELQGFTLGLASPDSDTVYPVPYAPPALVRTVLSGGSLQLSWPTASGSWGVQSAPTPAGPWNDTGWTPTTQGANSEVTVPAGYNYTYFRLVAD